MQPVLTDYNQNEMARQILEKSAHAGFHYNLPISSVATKHGQRYVAIFATCQYVTLSLCHSGLLKMDNDVTYIYIYMYNELTACDNRCCFLYQRRLHLVKR